MKMKVSYAVKKLIYIAFSIVPIDILLFKGAAAWSAGLNMISEINLIYLIISIFFYPVGVGVFKKTIYRNK